MDTHERNTGPMLASPRCGALTRRKTPCAAPAVRGKMRCRMHGGAEGSGAPLGNSNALKHGLHTARSMALRKHAQRLLRESRKVLRET